MKKTTTFKQVQINGFQSAVEALQFLPQKIRNRVLEEIAQKNQAMADKLKSHLFDFDQIEYLLSLDFKVLWWEVPRQVWYRALRKTRPGVLLMIKSNLSQRAFNELEDGIKSLGPLPLSLVMSAQKEICNLILKLSSEGRMALPSKDQNDPLI